MHQKLLDGIEGVHDGVWIDVEGIEWKTIHFKGINTATLHICGSSDPIKPANNIHEIQIGEDISQDCLVSVRDLVRWIKVRCSSYTAGTISAFIVGRNLSSFNG